MTNVFQKKAMLGVIAILAVAISIFVYTFWYRHVGLMVHNEMPREIIIESIIVNGGKSIYQGKKPLKAQTRSFQNGANFGFKHLGKVNEIVIGGHADIPFRLACTTESYDYSCYYSITVRSTKEMSCGCDNPNDFYK